MGGGAIKGHKPSLCLLIARDTEQNSEGRLAGLKKIYQRFFYVPKHAEVSARVFKTRTALSVLTILTCCVMFCSATFASFTSAQSAGIATITTAIYSLDITVDGVSIGTCDSAGSVTYTCPLAADDKHTVTITPTGTAETGYCVINGGDKTNSTEQINANDRRALWRPRRGDIEL